MDSERIPPGRPLTSVLPSFTHSGDLVGDTGKLDDHEQINTAAGSKSVRNKSTTL